MSLFWGFCALMAVMLVLNLLDSWWAAHKTRLATFASAKDIVSDGVYYFHVEHSSDTWTVSLWNAIGRGYKVGTRKFYHQPTEYEVAKAVQGIYLDANPETVEYDL